MSISDRLYRLLIYLYSRALRVEYGADMAADFRLMVAEARSRGTRLPTLRTWLRVLADLIVSAPGDRVRRASPPPRRARGSPTWKETPMGIHLQDVRFALRVLRRQPLFVLVASLTVAIGVGATATIFSVTNSLLLRPPAGVINAGELVTIHRIDQQGSGFHAFGTPYYRQMAAAGAVDELAAYAIFEGGLAAGDEASRVTGGVVSGNYFRALGTHPVMGRLIEPGDDEVPGRDLVAVISYRMWERLGGDAGVVGRPMQLNGRSFTVVGVAEPGFQGHVAIFSADIWVPLSAQGVIRGASDLSEETASAGLELIGRLNPGQSSTQARQALDAAGASYAAERGEEWFGIDVFGYAPIFPAAREPLTAFLAALFVVAGVLMTITAVNVANMLLSRGVSRSREIGVRLAMGATRMRLVTQLLTESSVLFALGGLLGVLLAVWSTALIARITLPVPVALDFDLRPDVGVLVFALGVAGLSGLLFGLSPALHATQGNLTSAIKEESTRRGGRSRLRNALVLVQVAGTVVLLVAAGLLVRSLAAAGSADLGLDPEGIFVLTVDPGAAGRSDEESRALFGRALEEARATPGIDSAAFIDIPPLSLANAQTRIVLPGRAAEPGEGFQRVEWARISGDYFNTVRIPLLEGRDFGPQDGRGNPLVVIVNETLADFAWPGESPVGKHIGFGSIADPIDAEIVGLAKNSKIRSPNDPPRMLVYVPWTHFQGDVTLMARARDAAAIAALRERVRALDPALPPAFVVPYPELVGVSLLPGRVAAALAGAFGLVGMLLAAIGLYGLLAFTVVQRRREIGIRLALGAAPRQVLRLVIGRGLRLTGIGLVVGLVAAAAAAQLLSGLLFGINPLDPTTYLTIVVVLLAAAALACWLPARRAAATDPAIALQSE